MIHIYVILNVLDEYLWLDVCHFQAQYSLVHHTSLSPILSYNKTRQIFTCCAEYNNIFQIFTNICFF